MAGTNILVRQKDLIAGTGISITPDTTSGNVTIAATNASIDESRLVPTGGKSGDILSYQEGVDQGNGDNVRLLLQNALTDSANGNAAPAAVTTQGVTLTGDNNLLFDGNDSHVTAVLATDEIFAADKEWTIDFWMKPTANSSEWNYILTENTGDWGSHSIGLTWNSDDSTLEQDTGGYLASVIRSSNWPNDAVACAADQWHFVAVEKQKTSTGWSLNYYLNGAIWLQVAFTGEFVPFDSSNPFWFGGKTTDSGRWFKGEANKLRVTTGARYGGKAFAVPDRLTDYAAPAGQPVWTEGIDRSRLLPEDPANGDIPCYSDEPPAGVNYNDLHTVLLLQGATTNDAKGTKLPFSVVGSPAAQDDGSLLFAANDQIKTTSAAEVKRVFGSEFTVDLYVKPTQFNSTSRQDTNFFNLSGPSTYRVYLSNFEDGGNTIKDKWGLWAYAGEREITLNNDEWHHVAVDVYLVSGTRKYTFYYDGIPVLTANWYNDGLASAAESVSAVITFFGASDNQNFTNGYVKSLRVSDVARYKGVQFDPPADGKYLTPPAGYWGKLNKSALVQNVNGQTPDSSGAVTLPEATTSAAGLMAAADKAAIAGLTAQGIYPNVAIATAGSGIDYNLFKTQGTFYIPYHTAVSNGPVSAGSNGVYPGGFLSILQANLSGGTSVQQIFHQHASNNAYIRSYNGDLDIWTDWVKLIVSTDQYSQSVVTLMDFNDYRTPGGYFFYTAAHLNSPDAPSNTAGWLVVEVVSGAREYTKQTYYAYSTRKTYIRTYNNNNHTWSPWHQQLSIADITESKTSSGYFKLPGGTIVQWGEQQVTAGSYTKVVFPIVFPTAFVSGTAIVYEADVEGSVGGYDLAVSIGGGTVSGMSVYAHGDSVGIGAIPAKFIAIGY